MAEIAAILLNALNYVLVLVLVALGLVVVFGMMRVINMAHGEPFMLGAYVVVAAGRAGAPFWAGVLAARVVVGLIGAAIEAGLIRHIYRRTLDFGASFELSAPAPRFYAVLAAAVYLALDRLLRAPFGVVLTAVKTNPARAEYFGYRIQGVRVAVFTVGAAVAGLAGALFAAADGFVSPTLIGFGLSTEVLIWVALGGREVPLAAFLGAVAVRLLEAYLAEMLGAYWLLALGLVFMASVVLLARGLIATPLERLARRIG